MGWKFQMRPKVRRYLNWHGFRASEMSTTLQYRRLAACGCIALIIVVWVSMAEFVQGLEESYPKPFLLTFAAHGSYVLCLLVWFIWRIWPWSNPEGGNFLGYFNWCYYFGASIPIAVVAFLSGWLWYLSLSRTSVSGNSAIYQSACTMVYVFSVVFLKEKVSWLKTGSVAISVGGVLLVSFFGSGGDAGENIRIASHFHPSLLGYALCFCSMVLYALYEVLYKRLASHSADAEPLWNGVRFLGLVGASTIIFCGPPLMLLDLLKFEIFETPWGEDMRKILVLGVLDTVFNLFLLFAIALVSPLFASVGCLLVLPASVAWDYFAHSYKLTVPALCGVGLIILGFGGFFLAETREGSGTPTTLYPYEVLEVPASGVSEQKATLTSGTAGDSLQASIGQPEAAGRADSLEIEENLEVEF